MSDVTIPIEPTDELIREMCRAHCRHEHHDPDADDGGQPLWKILEPAMRASYAAMVATATPATAVKADGIDLAAALLSRLAGDVESNAIGKPQPQKANDQLIGAALRRASNRVLDLARDCRKGRLAPAPPPPALYPSGWDRTR